MSVLVFANGEIENVDWLRPYLASATTIIAADGGTRYLMQLGRLPDVVIGDMDSLPAAARSWLETAGVRFITHPAAKDETDLELALRYAVEQFQDEILLFGALGGRLDQTLANIMLLAHPALAGRPLRLVNDGEQAWLVGSQTEIHGAVGDTVSLIPLAEEVLVQATTGLQWGLQNERLAFGPARGISNVMTAEVATISVARGRLLCVHSRGS